MIENIRFGIIGTGSIATACHAPALNAVEGVSLWSVLSRDKERASQFAQNYGAAARQPAHISLSDFLKDPLLQAVIITSPDKLHADHILACAQAGKHILVEKPMVTSHEEGQAAIAMCERQDVRLGVGFHLRWHDGHRRLHKIVDEKNTLGDLQHIQINWMTKTDNNLNWRASPESGRWWSLAANGSHCLDLMHWFADDGKRTLLECDSVFGKEKWGGPHEETVKANFKYSDGLTVQIKTSVIDEPSSLLEIRGTKGNAVCNGTLSRFSKGEIFVNDISFPFGPIQPFHAQIADFAAAVRDNRAPEVSGRQGLINVDTMIAIEQSALEKKDLQNLKEGIKLYEHRRNSHRAKHIGPY